MNAAQLHLALNHVPVLLPPVGAILLAVGLGVKSLDLKKAGLVILIVAALAAIPAYLSGEPTEAILKNYPGVSRIAIHEHESLAKIAFIALEAAGAGGLLALILVSRKRAVPTIAWATLLSLSLGVLGLFLQTAHLGGLIRHEELQTNEERERFDAERTISPAPQR